MNYLLDTNICIYIINKKPSSVIKRIQTKQPEQIAISTITQAELEYGIARSRNADQNRIALLEFLFPFLLIDFDQMAAVQYGLIRASLACISHTVARFLGQIPFKGVHSSPHDC